MKNNHDQISQSVNEGKIMMNRNKLNSYQNYDNNENYSKTEKSTKTQSRMDMQSLVEMCTRKLEIDPIHKKALLLRASSFIKNNEFDMVCEFAIFFS
jgi:hypothetical protein